MLPHTSMPFSHLQSKLTCEWDCMLSYALMQGDIKYQQEVHPLEKCIYDSESSGCL